jgi:putative restriction endonuclease
MPMSKPYSYSIDEYKRGLLAIKNGLSEKEIKMLQFQYSCPGRKTHAIQLADAMGYTYYGWANSNYGRLGHRLYDAIGRNTNKEKYWFEILSIGHQGEYGYWTMYPALAAALEELNIVSDGSNRLPEEVPSPSQLYEGAKCRIIINAYERNPRARHKCIAHYGAICSVCGLDFEKRYGTIAKGFIHVHHLRQLSDLGEKYQVDPIKDLRPVCPNCHAAIHLRNPAFTIEEVQGMLTKNAKSH